MKKKINLKDTTFVIPIRLDSINRLENLVMTVNYIYDNFDTNIDVLEASYIDTGFIKSILGTKINYIFAKDNDNVFHKTKYLNILIKNVNTSIVAVWDADIIIPCKQILSSIEELRKSNVYYSYPYDGLFLDTTNIIREYYFMTGKISVLEDNMNKMRAIYGSNMVGGAYCVNKTIYFEVGLENESFYGWGSEDFERHYRWKNLGYTIHRAKGCLFHLSHNRGLNSSFRSDNQIRNTTLAHLKTKNSSKNEIHRDKDNYTKDVIS